MFIYLLGPRGSNISQKVPPMTRQLLSRARSDDIHHEPKEQRIPPSLSQFTGPTTPTTAKDISYRIVIPVDNAISGERWDIDTVRIQELLPEY
jgi:hypothetical protein